jgi:hypothetical protein
VQEMSTKIYRIIVSSVTVWALRTMVIWGQFVARFGWHLVMLLTCEFRGNEPKEGLTFCMDVNEIIFPSAVRSMAFLDLISFGEVFVKRHTCCSHSCLFFAV